MKAAGTIEPRSDRPWTASRLLNAETRRYPGAVLVGMVWALAFPLPGWAGLAWVVPGALLLIPAGLPGASTFRVGWVAGVVHHLMALRWLLSMPHAVGAVAGWLALSGYCAVYAGAWTWFARRVVLAMLGPGEAAIQPGATAGWLEWMRRLAQRSWLQRTIAWATLAAGWVTLEMIRARMFSGFAWNLLGGSQWRQVPLIQLASVTGVYGLSFLICWMSLALTGAWLIMGFRPGNCWGWTAEIRLPLLAVLLLAGWGFWTALELRHLRDTAPRSLQLALVQPSVPQTLQWDSAADAASFERILGLSEQALALKPEILVWPEGSFGLAQETWGRMTNRVISAQASWIFNTIGQDSHGRPVNSAMWLDADGRISGQYDKRRLVIFGEYIPLERWLPFMRWLTPIGSSFAAGGDPVSFVLRLNPTDPPVKVAPIICFEDTFPHGVREHVQSDTDFLLEITNDAWFGEGSAQWQHAANAAFRAVENGVPMVRAANNGLTQWFDAAGIIHELFGENGRVYQPGFLMVRLPVGQARPSTYYHRQGDVFGWTCVAWTAWTLVATHRSRAGKALEISWPGLGRKPGTPGARPPAG